MRCPGRALGGSSASFSDWRVQVVPEADLHRVIAYFADPACGAAAGLARRLHQDTAALGAFFQSYVLPFHSTLQNWIPDPVYDNAFALALKCQLMDWASRPAYPAVSAWLRDAIGSRNLPALFKLLQGLRLARKLGGPDQEWLRSCSGLPPVVHNIFLYEGTELLWRKLVLAAGVFDLDVGEPGPLWLAACRARSTEALAALLQAGADPNRSSRSGGTALHACIEGAAQGQKIEVQLAKLRLLLAQPGIDPNRIYQRGGIYAGTPLHQAVFMNVPQAVEVLLQHPATDVDGLALIEYGHWIVPRVSPLALAVFTCLGDSTHSAQTVETLAAAGARMQLFTTAGSTEDCADDIDRFRQLCADFQDDEVPITRQATLRAALVQGRQARVCRLEKGSEA